MPVQTRQLDHVIAGKRRWKAIQEAHDCWCSEDWAPPPGEEVKLGKVSFYQRLRVWKKNGWEFRQKPK
jgi:hypothetical protein